jgi:hypothetical protein
MFCGLGFTDLWSLGGGALASLSPPRPKRASRAVNHAQDAHATNFYLLHRSAISN